MDVSRSRSTVFELRTLVDLYVRAGLGTRQKHMLKLTFLLLRLSSVGYILFLANVSVVTGATGGAVGGGGGGGEVVSNGMVPVSGTAYSYVESET